MGYWEYALCTITQPSSLSNKWTGIPSGGIKTNYEITSSLEWLENDLNQARKQGKGIILNYHDVQDHFNNISHPSAYSRFEAMISKYKVAAIFTGHLHPFLGKKTLINGVPVFFCGAPHYKNYLEVNFQGNTLVVNPKTYGYVASQFMSRFNLSAETITIQTNMEDLPITPQRFPEQSSASQQTLTFELKSGFTTMAAVRYLDQLNEERIIYKEWKGGTRTMSIPADAQKVSIKLTGKKGITHKNIGYFDKGASTHFRQTGSFNNISVSDKTVELKNKTANLIKFILHYEYVTNHVDFDKKSEYSDILALNASQGIAVPFDKLNINHSKPNQIIDKIFLTVATNNNRVLIDRLEIPKNEPQQNFELKGTLNGSILEKNGSIFFSTASPNQNENQEIKVVNNVCGQERIQFQISYLENGTWKYSTMSNKFSCGLSSKILYPRGKSAETWINIFQKGDKKTWINVPITNETKRTYKVQKNKSTKKLELVLNN